MTLLDPRHTDTADLLSLIRDIGERLDGIGERLDGISERLDHIEDDSIERIGDDTAEITCKLSMIAQLLTGAWPAGGQA